MILKATLAKNAWNYTLCLEYKIVDTHHGCARIQETVESAALEGYKAPQ